MGYQIDGPASDVPLVLLHGFCEDSSVWEPILPYFDDIPLVRLDLPGFGASDLSASSDISACAEAIFKTLKGLGITRCALVGHSLGGYVALEYLQRYPEHLVGIGLFHSHPYPDAPERILARKRAIEMLQQGKRDLYVTQLFPGLFAPSFAATHPEVIQILTERGKQQSAAGIIAALETMMHRPAYLETLENASCPVLFLLGREDALIPVDSALQAAVLPPICDLHLLPGVGHMAMWEAPQISADAVRQWFNRL